MKTVIVKVNNRFIIKGNRYILIHKRFKSYEYIKIKTVEELLTSIIKHYDESKIDKNLSASL